MKKFKRIARNNKIVYANWFLRRGEAIWEFIDDHLIPWKIIYWFDKQKTEFVYALERAFTGYDRTIHWSHQSSIDFYKRLLSNLDKYAHGCPPNLNEICPDEWKVVEEKWQSECKDGQNVSDLFFYNDYLDNAKREEFVDDAMKCWHAYIKRVLNYFNEADADTCSKRKEQEELYSKLDFPFDDDKMKVVEHNGELVYEYSSLDNSEESNKQREILDKLNSIEEYMVEQFKLGMSEIGKNALYLND